MREVMLLVIEVIHQDDHAVEHRDDWHVSRFLPLQSTTLAHIGKGKYNSDASAFRSLVLSLLIESGLFRITCRTPQEVFAMLKRTLAFAGAFIVTASTAQFAQTGQQTA